MTSHAPFQRLAFGHTITFLAFSSRMHSAARYIFTSFSSLNYFLGCVTSEGEERLGERPYIVTKTLSTRRIMSPSAKPFANIFQKKLLTWKMRRDFWYFMANEHPRNMTKPVYN